MGGTEGEWTAHTIEQRLDRSGFLDDYAVQVEHSTHNRRQPIETRLLTAYGRNTYSADEVPDPPAGQGGDTGKPDPRLPIETDDGNQDEHDS